MQSRCDTRAASAHWASIEMAGALAIPLPMATSTRSARFGLPEARLVLLSAGEAENPSFREAASQTLDWQLLVALAHKEGALPRVTALASAGQFPQMTNEVRQRLATLSMLHDFRAAMLEERASGLLTRLHEAGISALLLKGAALATTVYARFRDRPMGDLDIMVRPEHAARASEIALASGWTASGSNPNERFYDGHQHSRPLKDNQNLRLGLDLHVNLLPSHAPFRIPLDDVWGSAMPASELAAARDRTAGAALPALVPVPEYLLLHACVHFVWSHSANSGGWKVFRDVDQIVRSPLFDAERFWKLADSARAGSCAYWTLRLAQRLGGVTQASKLVEGRRAPTLTWQLRSLDNHFGALLTRALTGRLPVRLNNRLWELAVRPEREGHAGARPWSRNALFEPDPEQKRPDDVRPGQLAQLRETMTYLAWIIGGKR